MCKLSCKARQLERYHFARNHGADAKLAVKLAGSVGKFREFVVSVGIDPDSLGECARHLGKGGKPRRFDPEAQERRRLYHELKALGADAKQASEGCTCSYAHARVMRELKGVFKKSDRVA